MDDLKEPLAAEAVAAGVAPIIDRLRIAIAHGIRERALSSTLISSVGMSEPALQVFAMLRNTFPARDVTDVQLRAVFRYQPAEATTAAIVELHGAGLIEGDDQGIHLCERGRSVMSQLRAMSAQTVSELWQGADDGIAALLPLVDRTLQAATASGGDAFAVVAPPYDGPQDPLSSRLAERLTGLRFHRFDAHVAAWQAGGLTAQTVQSLGPGPQRTIIEADTNRRAALPYAVLGQSERLDLIAGLGALRG